MTADLDIPGLDVSRETLSRLEQFAGLVAKWTRRINLVAAASLPHIWGRHIRDSAQLVLIPDRPPDRWLDLGSGGGFPGIVVAVLAAEIWPDARVTLVESDQRKAAFLRTAARELTLDVEVRAERAETMPPFFADVLSARALAPLSDLMGLAHRHLAPNGMAIFPKGRNAMAEVDAARRDWRFALAIRDSLTDHEGRLLRIERIERA